MALRACIACTVCIVFVWSSCGQYDALDLDYTSFDQTPHSGWRRYVDDRRYAEAAEIIDRYLDTHAGLTLRQRKTLLLHAGQMYAYINRRDKAIQRLTASKYPETQEAPVWWNPYVEATLAFLQNDLDELRIQRDIIAGGPEIDGVIPNLAAADTLIAYFNRPYHEAYNALRDHEYPP